MMTARIQNEIDRLRREVEALRRGLQQQAARIEPLPHLLDRLSAAAAEQAPDGAADVPSQPGNTPPETVTEEHRARERRIGERRLGERRVRERRAGERRAS